jgi:hypothetical protein
MFILAVAAVAEGLELRPDIAKRRRCVVKAAVNGFLTIWVRDQQRENPCTKGGADGFPNVCRTRQNAPAGFGFGQRGVETL